MTASGRELQSVGGPARARDQLASAFTDALERLCASLPAVAAALVDAEGETVDYAGRLTPFEIRLIAAEWQIVLDNTRRAASRLFGSPDRIWVRAQGASYCLVALTEGYALIVRLPLGAFNASERALCQAIHDVCDEAGLSLPEAYQRQRWTRVSVREGSDVRRRPVSLCFDDVWHALDVIGCYEGHDLSRRERGYRVRLSNGLETTLVRESFGRWFADYAGASARR